MTRHVALLRAVNVGGRGMVAMTDLRKVAEAIGFTEVTTILQSGSLTFSAKGGGLALERKLQWALKDKLGLVSEVMIRSVDQWQAIVEDNPFPKEADSDPSHLLVLTGKSPINAAVATVVRAAIKGREQVAVQGCTAYAFYPDGIGRSKLTTAVLERLLGTPVTGRNWNTVRKIAELLGA